MKVQISDNHVIPAGKLINPKTRRPLPDTRATKSKKSTPDVPANSCLKKESCKTIAKESREKVSTNKLIPHIHHEDTPDSLDKTESEAADGTASITSNL